MSPNNYCQTNTGGYDACRVSEAILADTTTTPLLALPSVTSPLNSASAVSFYSHSFQQQQQQRDYNNNNMNSQSLVSIIDNVLCLVSADDFGDFEDDVDKQVDSTSKSSSSTTSGSFSRQ